VADRSLQLGGQRLVVEIGELLTQLRDVFVGRAPSETSSFELEESLLLALAEEAHAAACHAGTVARCFLG